MTTTLDKIRAAIVQLLRKEYVFFGILVMHLKLVEDKNLTSLAATDGRVFMYNPDIIEQMKLTNRNLQAVLAHEVLHIVLDHIPRMGNRHQFKWNLATDFVINLRLKGDGFDLPSGVALDDKYAKMSAEEVYALLPEVECDGRKYIVLGKNENGKSFTVLDKLEKISAQEGQKLREDMASRIVEAAEIAKMRGTVPSSVEDIVKDIMEPKLDPRQYLRRFLINSLEDDFKWIPPNKRFMETGFIFPSMNGEGLGTIVIGVDTSGSIDNKEASQFFGEIQSILNIYDVNLIMIECDANVQWVNKFKRGDKLKDVIFKGRGGTAFEPVFEYIEKEHIKPSCMLFFTDMYGSFPKDEPNYPVLWISTSGEKAPFGETIHLDCK